jgi:hypothetical protein
MKWLADARAISDARADVCVIGAGPVGLSLATSLCRRGVHVLLIESGLRRQSARLQRLSEADIISTASHAPMSQTVCRRFGGGSWIWGGRCLPLDPIDFVARPYVAGGEWPISESEVASYYGEAAALLGCGPAEFQARETEWDQSIEDGSGLCTTKLERWCNEPILARSWFSEHRSKTLSIALGSTVTGAYLSSDGDSIEGISVVCGGEPIACKAAHFVFACGGLETARLMLNIQARHGHLFGGRDGPLGRYYMGHMSGCISEISFSRPQDAKRFQFQSASGSGFRRRLTLSAPLQKAEALPNVAFYPDNPKMSDPAHKSGVLSSIFLALCAPTIGRRIISDGIRQMHMTNRPQYFSHFCNILRDFPNTVSTSVDLVKQKIVQGRRKPFFFLANQTGKYPLHYHGEHYACPESRVLLTDDCDQFGLRRISIDLRFSTEGADGVFRAHKILDRELRASGLGHLVFHSTPASYTARILAQARDGFHQIGLTRMGHDSSDGVVDRNCKAFGVTNLFVAGSSVFRSSGQANPTFFATALALRLADNIASNLMPT